jgi:hypothetical protein
VFLVWNILIMKRHTQDEHWNIQDSEGI